MIQITAPHIWYTSGYIRRLMYDLGHPSVHWGIGVVRSVVNQIKRNLVLDSRKISFEHIFSWVASTKPHPVHIIFHPRTFWAQVCCKSSKYFLSSAFILDASIKAADFSASEESEESFGVTNSHQAKSVRRLIHTLTWFFRSFAASLSSWVFLPVAIWDFQSYQMQCIAT